MFTKASLKSRVAQSCRALIGTLAFLTIATGTVACNSDDIAVIGGTIAIVAGAIAIDDALDRGSSRRCEGGYRNECRSIHDRWGRLHRDCNRVWDSCARRFSGDFSLDASSPLALSVPETDVSKLAMKYNIPLESAERLTSVLKSAAAGDSAPLIAMGLSKDEMNRVAKYLLPSDAALDQIGTSLAMSRTMSRGLVQQLMDETRVQMSDVNSAAWTACQKTGKWKTDANGGTCKSTEWSGCSPRTGASMCAAVN